MNLLNVLNLMKKKDGMPLVMKGNAEERKSDSGLLEK